MDNPDLSLIQLKINAIGTALFFPGHHSPLPFSACLVTALKMDDEGCVWFFMGRGSCRDIDCDKCFDAGLEFYRKGYPAFVKIEGRASIEYAGSRLQEILGRSIPLNQEITDNILLVKLKMESACCKELRVFSAARYIDNVFDGYKRLVQRLSAQWPSTLYHSGATPEI